MCNRTTIALKLHNCWTVPANCCLKNIKKLDQVSWILFWGINSCLSTPYWTLLSNWYQNWCQTSFDEIFLLWLDLHNPWNELYWPLQWLKSCMCLGSDEKPANVIICLSSVFPMHSMYPSNIDWPRSSDPNRFIVALNSKQATLVVGKKSHAKLLVRTTQHDCLYWQIASQPLWQ